VYGCFLNIFAASSDVILPGLTPNIHGISHGDPSGLVKITENSVGAGCAFPIMCAVKIAAEMTVISSKARRDRRSISVRQNLRQEQLGAFTFRSGEEIFRRALIHDLPLIEEQDAIRDFTGKAHLVRHD